LIVICWYYNVISRCHFNIVLACYFHTINRLFF